MFLDSRSNNIQIFNSVPRVSTNELNVTFFCIIPRLGRTDPQ